MSAFEFTSTYLCHANNLAQKARAADTDSRKQLVAEIQAAYRTFLEKLDYGQIRQRQLGSSASALEEYVQIAKIIEKKDRFFNWRSDFASSIIPEFVYRCLHYILKEEGIEPLFATRDSVVEVTLSGAIKGGWNIRHKNQDLAIGLRREKIEKDGKQEPFVVPVVAFEIKTNIDINKLNGLNFSAERLKRTFPNARYFVVTETIYFSLQDNYAAGSIDEIYVLRKQVRSEARRSKAVLSADVLAQLFDDIVELMVRAGRDPGHVYERLNAGRLIHT